MPNPYSNATVPMSSGGVPMGQPQDPMPMFTQRLETSLNPKIGVPGQDTQPVQQAEFMLKNDAAGAVKLAQTIMQAVQQKMMQARQAAMMRQPQPMQPPPQMMSQGMPPMGGQ